jgi:hypothetical protein
MEFDSLLLLLCAYFAEVFAVFSLFLCAFFPLRSNGNSRRKPRRYPRWIGAGNARYI